MTTFKTKIGKQPFEVNSLLENYELHHTPQSSYVAFFGLNKEEGKFFMQFNNGTAFIYDMPAEEQQAALEADSIGKYFHAEIKGVHIGEQIAALSIAPDNSVSEASEIGHMGFTDDLNRKGDPRDDFDDLGSNAHGLSFDDDDDLDDEY